MQYFSYCKTNMDEDNFPSSLEDRDKEDCQHSLLGSLTSNNDSIPANGSAMKGPNIQFNQEIFAPLSTSNSKECSNILSMTHVNSPCTTPIASDYFACDVDNHSLQSNCSLRSIDIELEAMPYYPNNVSFEKDIGMLCKEKGDHMADVLLSLKHAVVHPHQVCDSYNQSFLPNRFQQSLSEDKYTSQTYSNSSSTFNSSEDTFLESILKSQKSFDNNIQIFTSSEESVPNKQKSVENFLGLDGFPDLPVLNEETFLTEDIGANFSSVFSVDKDAGSVDSHNLSIFSTQTTSQETINPNPVYHLSVSNQTTQQEIFSESGTVAEDSTQDCNFSVQTSSIQTSFGNVIDGQSLSPSHYDTNICHLNLLDSCQDNSLNVNMYSPKCGLSLISTPIISPLENIDDIDIALVVSMFLSTHESQNISEKTAETFENSEVIEVNMEDVETNNRQKSLDNENSILYNFDEGLLNEIPIQDSELDQGISGMMGSGTCGYSSGGYQDTGYSSSPHMFPAMSVNVSMNMTMGVSNVNMGYSPEPPLQHQWPASCGGAQGSSPMGCMNYSQHSTSGNLVAPLPIPYSTSPCSQSYGMGGYSWTGDLRGDTNHHFQPFEKDICLKSPPSLRPRPVSPQTPYFSHSSGMSSPQSHTLNALRRRSCVGDVVNSSLMDKTRCNDAMRNNLCRICGKTYARPSTLKTHLRTHSGEKPYRCNECNKSFSQAANLTAHVRTHSGEKPFRCPICDRRFSQSSSVTTHMRTHSGERPYRCRMCKKAFSDSSTLTKHLRIHSGEKPYQCKLCLLRFSQSGNLNRHMRVHAQTS